MENESVRVLHVINSLATGGAEKLILDSLPIYKEKGFYPSEFVEDITKVKLKINNWPDAIAAVKHFLDLSEESDAIH